MATIAARDPAATKAVVEAADRVADLRFQFFGYPEVQLPRPVCWHYDPGSDVRWPDAPSTRIDHRTAAGDPKWIWELNRLQHLPWLAQAWLLTGDRRYSRACFEQLDSWLDQFPPGRGIAWRGAFEAGIRAIAVAVAVQGFRDSPDLTVPRYRRILAMLAESGRRCWRDRSLFSSANNHLIGELCGLAVIAVIFPELAAASRWERRALRELSEQADRQILPDGGGAEQAVGYQLFVVELLVLVAHLVRLRDGAAPPRLAAAVERSADYLCALVGDQDPDPRYGDDDEGFALRLGAEAVRTVRDHLGIVAAATDHAGSRDYGRRTLTAQWLSSAATATGDGRDLADRSGAPPGFYAPQTGVVVLRGRGRRLLMDVGPLGYLALAAHGHADALAVTLALDGADIVGDPGAGSYYGHPEWRRVLRGTRAHGTVTLDGTDQSVIGGPFLWSEHARTTVHRVDLVAGIVDAEHDGYSRRPGRGRHRRWLVAPPDWDEVLVVDRVSGAGDHEVRLTWPLAPDLEVEAPDASLVGAGDRHVVRRAGADVVHLQYAVVGGSGRAVRLEQVRGGEDGAGWWSPRLESRVPAWWIGATCRAELPVALATLFWPASAGGGPEHLALSASGDVLEICWASSAGPRRVRIDPAGSGSVIVDRS